MTTFSIVNLLLTPRTYRNIHRKKTTEQLQNVISSMVFARLNSEKFELQCEAETSPEKNDCDSITTKFVSFSHS